MSLILSLETSTKVCSIALHKENQLVSSTIIKVDKSHSKVIIPFIEGVLKFSGFTISDVDAVAVSKGPGSYTGLRIGVSTAKGLCLSIDKPLIAINTLRSMAFEINKCNFGKYLVCPMIDARRMEVYCSLFDSDNKILEETQAIVVDSNSFQDYFSDNKIIFFGDGAAKCLSLFSGNKNAVFIEDVFPSAINIGYLAFDKLKNGEFEDIAYFEPFYLKDFISK